MKSSLCHRYRKSQNQSNLGETLQNKVRMTMRTHPLPESSFNALAVSLSSPLCIESLLAHNAEDLISDDIKVQLTQVIHEQLPDLRKVPNFRSDFLTDEATTRNLFSFQ
jgi:hypothetical protein